MSMKLRSYGSSTAGPRGWNAAPCKAYEVVVRLHNRPDPGAGQTGATVRAFHAGGLARSSALSTFRAAAPQGAGILKAILAGSQERGLVGQECGAVDPRSTPGRARRKEARCRPRHPRQGGHPAFVSQGQRTPLGAASATDRYRASSPACGPRNCAGYRGGRLILISARSQSASGPTSGVASACRNRPPDSGKSRWGRPCSTP